MSVISKTEATRPHAVLRLPATIRALHWATAALLVPLFPLAWSLDWIGPGDLGIGIVELHRSFGLLLLVVVLARLVWRATHRLPPAAHAAPRWERLLASGVQAGLYLCLLAMPLLGWSASALSGDTIRVFGLRLPDLVAMNEDLGDRLFQLHGTLSWVLLGLTALHVAGALRHQFLKRDGLIDRMRIF